MIALIMLVEQLLIMLTFFLAVNVIRLIGLGDLLWPSATAEGAYLLQFFLGLLIASGIFYISVYLAGFKWWISGPIKVICAIATGLFLVAISLLIMRMLSWIAFEQRNVPLHGDVVFYISIFVVCLLALFVFIILLGRLETPRIRLDVVSVFVSFAVGSTLLIVFTGGHGSKIFEIISFALGILAYFGVRMLSGRLEFVVTPWRSSGIAS